MTRLAGPYRMDNPWRLIAITVVAGAVTFAFVFGFLILPRFQQSNASRSTWETVCQALGFQQYRSAAAVANAGHVPSDVVWSDTFLRKAVSGDPAKGEFIAWNCAACHGAQGFSKRAWVPSLAGMDKAAIYKQLCDFRSDKRLFGVMNGVAQSLSDQDYADVAAYYASLQPGLGSTEGPRVPESGESLHSKDSIRRLVFGGDPARGVAPCAACHGPGGFHLSAPSLRGQHADYIVWQLGQFAQTNRANDINQPMRTIASQLSDEEMARVAEFYSGEKLSDERRQFVEPSLQH